MRMTFTRWLALLALHADFIDYPTADDPEAWWVYYNRGLTPEDALQEDISHADWEPRP
jgi:hypothetical protein